VRNNTKNSGATDKFETQVSQFNPIAIAIGEAHRLETNTLAQRMQEESEKAAKSTIRYEFSVIQS
jgi:hypothetical protein